MLHLRPWLNQLTIKTTANDYRPLDLDYVDPDPTIGDWGWAQRPFIGEIERQYNEGLPVRIIVLKARQLGISTATEAVLFLWAFIHRGSNGVVISHEDGQAQQLFVMTQRYWEHWPYNDLLKLKYATRRQMKWLETESQLLVATAKNAEKLRGSTFHAVHASEVAFWENPGELWTALSQTIPHRHGTIVVLESTANGVGNWFHDQWLAAEAGDSDFVPMFFPWYRHAACRVYANNLHTSDLNVEEKEIRHRMQIERIGEEDIMAALAYRRWAIPNRVDSIEEFHQEYPTTPEEAFLTSGKPIFHPSRVEDCYDERRGARGYLYRNGVGQVVFEPDPSGDLTIFRRPDPSATPDLYFVAGDPSRTTYGDPGCIQVINRRTLEQIAVWHGHVDPYQFGREMMLIGDFFGHAMLAPECDGGGQGSIGVILQSGYGNVWRWAKPDRTNSTGNTWGWETSYKTKHWAVATLQHYINDRSLLIHDKRTKLELLNFVEHPDGELGNAGRSEHDDTVMALAIAVTASTQVGLYKPASHTPTLDIFTSELEGGYERDVVRYAVDLYNNERTA